MITTLYNQEMEDKQRDDDWKKESKVIEKLKVFFESQEDVRAATEKDYVEYAKLRLELNCDGYEYNGSFSNFLSKWYVIEKPVFLPPFFGANSISIIIKGEGQILKAKDKWSSEHNNCFDGFGHSSIYDSRAKEADHLHFPLFIDSLKGIYTPFKPKKIRGQ